MADGTPSPSPRRRSKQLRVQVSDHVDLRVSYHVYLSPRVITLLGALGLGGGGWWIFLQR